MITKKILINSQSYFEVNDTRLSFYEEEASGNIIEFEIELKNIRSIHYRKRLPHSNNQGCNIFFSMLFLTVTEIDKTVTYSPAKIHINYTDKDEFKTFKIVSIYITDEIYNELNNCVFGNGLNYRI